MARAKAGMPIPDYSTKKGVDEIPIAPCQGWIDECEFCEKRLGKWEEVTDDVLAKVPTKPGIFAIALKNKNVTEVVDIVLDSSDIQKAAYNHIDQTKNNVSDKKSKVTKSVILCRWMIKQPKDKDVINLCAHWYNNGVLPKQMETWPGVYILQCTDTVAFSDRLQKWCLPQKDAFWKKPKGPPTKLAELVEGCVWKEPCENCDSYFGEWRKLDEVVFDDLAPSSRGVYMLAVEYGKTIETINICFDLKLISLDIKDGMKDTQKNLSYILKTKKYLNKNTTFLVRWLEISDVDSDNCCFLYAHWLNSENMPEMNFKLPGERQLEKNKYFVLRNHDKKWCYEIEIFKNLKKSKYKIKKHIMQDLEEDYRNLNCSDDA